ncbi:hypothetical protein [Pseudogulbenkiania subflava]|uniref:Uncharacterized protein n=1 Tax=Pseudogulbenkiania subflava DSM 22618 TaxID=1123014 RepID=A0A1Y6BD08_9NEIS|nr:hypothetical protein [Pseudogulbenkiania subflava]SMF01511.1 hypothetical protein SAMN02745746_00729 [Pseudogulbenkiania subflava DSM 22618]
MMALGILLFLFLYLLLSLWATVKSYSFAQRRWRRGWIGGGVALLVMYHLVFWDWIPVYWMHKHYCETEAGFWVYKTPEQWIKENPNAEGNVGGNSLPPAEGVTNQMDRKYRYWITPYIYSESIGMHPFYEINKKELRLVDGRTRKLLARSVEFYRGPGGEFGKDGYRIWLTWGKRNCGPVSTFDGISYDPEKHFSGYDGMFGIYERKILKLSKGNVQ